MKICVINNLYKPFVRGGAETVTANLADGMEKDGHKVIVISTKPYKSKIKSEKNIYRINSMYFGLRRMPLFLRIFWHIYDMVDFVSAIRVFFIIKKEMPDAVITNNLKGISFLTPTAIRLLKKKHIHILHDIQLLYPSGLLIYGQEKILQKSLARVYQFINKRLFFFPKIIISPSEWLLSLHTTLGFFKKNKKIVINNPTEIDWPKKFCETTEPARTKIFLYAGQIEPHKGVEILLQSFTACLDHLPDEYTLAIIGEGSSLEYLKKKYTNDRIIFLGHINREKVVNMMASSYCLIVPSCCYENSPTVVYEALSVGLPVIASDIGGLGELVKKTAGYLVKPSAVNDLADMITWAAAHPANLSSLGQIGRQKIHSYKNSNYINQITDLLD
jgi:glycosyltransferase involved in cell wall biosynthesis